MMTRYGGRICLDTRAQSGPWPTEATAKRPAETIADPPTELPYPMRWWELEVRGDVFSNAVAFGVRRLPPHTRGNSDGKRVRWDLHSLRTHGAGPDARAGPDMHAIQ